MLQEAINKLKTEMDQNKKNSYVQVVGGFLLQHLDNNPGAAENILVEDKSITKSLAEMKKEAEKKKVGNCAVITDQEGFTVVLKYFGIKGTVPAAPSVVAAAPAPPAVSTGFDVKLEDLL